MSAAADNIDRERLETLEGVLDRLAFSGETTDFVVARLSVRGRREPVTIVGNLPNPHPGETLVLRGHWEFDKKFGEQFRFLEAEAKAPSSVEGIEKYLASSLIKGIGPQMARRITAVFGNETLNVIEKNPADLLKVSGIGKVRAEKIAQAFQEQKSIREVMLFLQSHGVSTAYAFRIFKRYGNESVRLVNENPYSLVRDIPGIGFRSADKIAGSLGVDLRSPLRARAGILHILETAQSDGHVYYPQSALLQKTAELLAIDVGRIEQALQVLAATHEVIIEDGRVYVAAMASMESSVAGRLLSLMTATRLLPSIKIDAAIKWVESRNRIALSDEQKKALSDALQYKVLIITGGPGTGKTTLLQSLIQILEAKKLRVTLAAPTGRAAKRLSQATGRDAKTLHRLLEYSPGLRVFQRNAGRPLEAEFVIIDEVSMVDLALMHHLLHAVHPHSSLVLVGDADQLPSVGPGNILGDLIRSGNLPTSQLKTVFRQARTSLIITNAHLVNEGKMPLEQAPGEILSDFYIVAKNDPDESVRLIKELVGHRIPERFGFNPLEDIQVLSPMRRGTLGTDNLNREIRDLLNSNGQSIRGDRFRVGDRVMQTRNNYDKEVFNGDVGRILSFDTEWEEAVIEFDGRSITYHVSEMDEIVLAYAVTIHKSQGSEYRGVVIALGTQHFVLLRRNLLYTAITRGKELVVIIGNTKALRMAVENSLVEPRYTHLAERL